MQTQALPLHRPLDEVLAFEHPRVVKRYVDDFGTTKDDAELRFLGMKQFLTVCRIMPGAKVTSDAIDTMWHTFLLFTRDYGRFCQDYLGEFIHHEPFETSNPSGYVATREFAQRMFGPLDDRLWPASAKGDCSSGCCSDGWSGAEGI